MDRASGVSLTTIRRRFFVLSLASVIRPSVPRGHNTIDPVDEIADSRPKPRREQPERPERWERHPVLDGGHERLRERFGELLLRHADRPAPITNAPPDFERGRRPWLSMQKFSNT